jgi:hypothetical protein
MLWVFDETVAARGGVGLIVDAALSLARQWLLRPIRRKPQVEKTAPESGTLAAMVRRTGWYRGLTPEIHGLILFAPVGFAVPLGIGSHEPQDLLLRPIHHAALALFTFAWYRLYKRRLLRSPLVAPLSLAHLPYRLQLEDSLKTIGGMGGTPVSKVRALAAGVTFLCFVVLWNIITAKLGYGRFSIHALQLCYLVSWIILRGWLNRYATQMLQREIECLPTNP